MFVTQGNDQNGKMLTFWKSNNKTIRNFFFQTAKKPEFNTCIELVRKRLRSRHRLSRGRGLKRDMVCYYVLRYFHVHTLGAPLKLA